MLRINIIEIEDDSGAYANRYIPFAVDPAEFIGKKVLAGLRCYQGRRETQDRGRVNDNEEARVKRMKEYLHLHIALSLSTQLSLSV